jgi:NAD(P)-dependent dehydrogenase (short-subunit alcohol dehydrogenase family)
MMADDEIEFSNGAYGLPPGGFRLDGKAVVVTGASSNIGLSIALGMAQAGSDVVMVARGPERLAKATEAVRKAEPRRKIVACPADVSTVEGVEATAEAVKAEFGMAHALVNCAVASGKSGIPADLKILEIPDRMWDETYQTNVVGAYRLIKALFNGHVEAERPASIINVVSGSGLLPVPVVHNTAYGASKAALWMMTRYLAVNLAPLIRVNALCPGNVSPSGQPHTETARKMLSSIPMGRIGKPGELAGAAVYLASDASSFTTGAMLVCNGGRDW